MKSKLRREIIRKSIHILTGFLFVWLTFLFKDIDVIFWFALALLIPFGLFYLSVRWFSHTTIGRFAKNAIEREDGHHTNGVGGLTYAGGVLLLYLIFGFDPVVVLTSIVVFSVGDGFASLVGMKWGKHKLNITGHVKTLEGFLGGFIAATLVSLLFIDLVTALIVSGITMLFELVGLRVRGREIPDNLYLPLIAGTVLYFIQIFL